VQTLWQALAELSVPREQDEREVRCVRVTLADDSALDVFRAYEIEGGVTAWRVRGFVEPGGEERVAVVLGTKDDRALVQWGPGHTPSMVPVAEHAETTRSLADLSDAMAAAVRRLMEPKPN